MNGTPTAAGLRAGACVVRAEADGPTGLRITLTARQDVHDPAGQVRWTTTSIPAALLWVRQFLEAFRGPPDGPERGADVTPP